MKSANKLGSSLLLFLTACIWGMAFVSQSKGMDYMDPFTFNGGRSLIGALALLLYILLTGRGRGMTKSQWAVTLRAGLWCGLAITVASTLQQFGVKYTTVGKAGFITTLYIIFVPIGGIFFKRKVPGMVWVCALLSAVGMYLLSVTESFTLGSGDILVLLCAVVFAVHIMVIDHYAQKTDGVIVSCIQFALCGIVCNLCALIWGEPSPGAIMDGMGALLYSGVLSCGVAYTLQIIGQRGVNPTVAALILSLESVIAAVSGWAAYKMGLLTTDQSLTPRQMAGCALVFGAVILVQLPKEWLDFLQKKTGMNKN